MMCRVTERYVAEGVWRAESALHVGGEGGAFDRPTDMVLLRDSQGRFLIPGASVAGAARSYLAQGAGLEQEPAALRALFGGGDKMANRDYASLLTVRDALQLGQPRAHVRDGVKIEAKYGIAADGAKYDLEILPRGTTFLLRFELALLERLPHDVDKDGVLGHFWLALRGFTKRAIRLGARTRRGFGAGVVDNWAVRRLDMSNLDHVQAWLSRDLSKVTSIPEPAPDPQPSKRERLTMEGWFRLKTSLLVRAAAEIGAGGQQPDSVHLTEEGVHILPGTGIAGALRQRCGRVAKLWGRETMVDGMFGRMDRDDRDNNRASRVWVSETHLGKGEIQVQGRVSIDRFTMAAKNSALFEEAAYWAADSQQGSHIRLALDDPRPEEIGLLALAFKDLWLGDLPLGGGVGSGRGVFTGWLASVTHERPEGAERVEWKRDDGDARIRVTEGKLDFLNRAVESLQEGKL